jgi:SAM-dependent methyltransferase
MINQRYQTLNILPKKQRRSLSYFGFPIQTLYLGFLEQQPKQKRVLDIGCGNGFLLRNLSYWDNQICGIDGSLELIERLKSIGMTQVQHCMFSKDKLSGDDRFDWIYCLDVIEHVKDRASFIDALYDLKTDQNHMVLVFPNQRHHGTDGLIDLNEFELLSKEYHVEVVQLLPPLWFSIIQWLKSNVKKLLGFKEGDLFHENPSFTKITKHPQSWILSRIIEFYFCLFDLMPSKTKRVNQLNEEGIYMIYFGKSL